MNAKVDSNDIPFQSPKPTIDALHAVLRVRCLATVSEASAVLHLRQLIAWTREHGRHILAVARSTHGNRVPDDQHIRQRRIEGCRWTAATCPGHRHGASNQKSK